MTDESRPAARPENEAGSGLTPERVEELKKAMEAFRSGETDEVEVDAPGGVKMRMVRDPEAKSGMRLERSDGEPIDIPVPQLFEPADDRPPDYPADIPFLPGFKAICAEIPPNKGLMVQYFRDGPAKEALAQIREQTVDAGWTEVEPEELDESRWEEIREKAIGRGVDESFVDRARDQFAQGDRFRFVKDDNTRTISHRLLDTEKTFVILAQKRTDAA